MSQIKPKNNPKKKPKTHIEKSTKVNCALVPIIKDLGNLGYSEADIGIIIAAAGKNPQKWFNNLKKKYPNVDDIGQLATTLANIQLVVAAMQAALGYDYVEEEIKYKVIEKCDPVAGKVWDEYIEESRKVKPKHAKKDKDLLKFLLVNRLSEYFSDIKKIQVDKRTIEFKGDMSEEIKSFAGKLLDSIRDKKQVESREVEVEN